MILKLFAGAVEEAAQAVAYYEEAEIGLGRLFRHELDELIDRILADPLLHRVRRDGLRRVNMPRFNFYVAYLVRGRALYIVAVSHAARRPGYFQTRLRRGLPP